MKMDGIYLLENRVQTYAWGSRTAIAELLGRKSPSGVPQAELWMGAHPKAPSGVITPMGTVELGKFIEQDPDGLLGVETARGFENRLPYLFKVLAAAMPLSIQAHPNIEQARAGFARENRQNVDIGSPERNYRDANHKPECICALSRFWGLNGFREPCAIARDLRSLCPEALGKVLDRNLPLHGGGDLRRFFETLMNLPPSECRRTVEEALARLDRLPPGDASANWIQKLQEHHPWDIGVLFPVILNLVCLSPGQALFLPAGRLHAYLEGVGIELMANSDNVLRGGLTPKHVDVPELMQVLNFSPTALEILTPVAVSETESVYQTDAKEFELAVIDLDRARPYTDGGRKTIQMLLCTEGRAVVTRKTAIVNIPVRKGTCLLVTAEADAFQIEGRATFYKAAVPEKS